MIGYRSRDEATYQQQRQVVDGARQFRESGSDNYLYRPRFVLDWASAARLGDIAQCQISREFRLGLDAADCRDIYQQ
jgi:hypothetical protein